MTAERTQSDDEDLVVRFKAPEQVDLELKLFCQLLFFQNQTFEEKKKNFMATTSVLFLDLVNSSAGNIFFPQSFK